MRGPVYVYAKCYGATKKFRWQPLKAYFPFRIVAAPEIWDILLLANYKGSGRLMGLVTKNKGGYNQYSVLAQTFLL